MESSDECMSNDAALKTIEGGSQASCVSCGSDVGPVCMMDLMQYWSGVLLFSMDISFNLSSYVRSSK